MVKYVIESLQEEIQELKRNHAMMFSELREIKNRGHIYICGNEYHCGIFLQACEFGYDESVKLIEALIEKYEEKLRYRQGLLDGLLEQ